MNKLEELHLNTHSHVLVTEQIAIEFGKWLYTTESLDLIHDMKLFGEDTSIENLFQEFLKTK